MAPELALIQKQEDWRGALKGRLPIFWGSLPAPRARSLVEIRPAS